MLAIVISEFSTSRVRAVSVNQRFGDAQPNGQGAGLSWRVTSPNAIGYTGDEPNRAAAVDAMLAQMAVE